MRIAVLQPGYLPWLGFFDQEMSVDQFVIYDNVQYDRRGWRNRNRVKTPNGMWLTVPVLQKGLYDQIIRDVKIELDMAMIRWMNGRIGIKTDIVMASDLGVSGQKSERLLEICRKLGANEYFSGAAARHYLDIGIFSEAGIKVYFQEYMHPVYPQLNGGFVSHLSALDLIMIALPEAGKIIESGRKWVIATDSAKGTGSHFA